LPSTIKKKEELRGGISGGGEGGREGGRERGREGVAEVGEFVGG